MSWNNKKYVILTASEAEDIDYSKVHETSASTLRWNTNNSKTFVKYVGSKPSFLYGKDTMTHRQIITELENDEWIGE